MASVVHGWRDYTGFGREVQLITNALHSIMITHIINNISVACLKRIPNKEIQVLLVRMEYRIHSQQCLGYLWSSLFRIVVGTGSLYLWCENKAGISIFYVMSQTYSIFHGQRTNQQDCLEIWSRKVLWLHNYWYSHHEPANENICTVSSFLCQLSSMLGVPFNIVNSRHDQ